MSKLPDNVTKLSDTLTLCEWTDLRNGNFGFWLWDETRGMNLSMKAKTPTDAFVEALTFYQKRLLKVEHEYKVLKGQVDAFVANFNDGEGDWRG